MRKKKKWGGNRKGAGRKVEVAGAVTKSIVFDIQAFKIVERYIKKNPKRDAEGKLLKTSEGKKCYPGFSEAVRRLIKQN